METNWVCKKNAIYGGMKIFVGLEKKERVNEICGTLRKRRHEGGEKEIEYQNAWTEYVKQQKLTECKIRDARAKSEGGVLNS